MVVAENHIVVGMVVGCTQEDTVGWGMAVVVLDMAAVGHRAGHPSWPKIHDTNIENVI